MNIALIQIGKTDAEWLRQGIEGYLRRINRYVKFDIVTIPDLRNAAKFTRERHKAEEGRLILGRLQESDTVVLLDEAGRQPSSTELADWLQKRMNAAPRRLCFVIGGPFGFSPEVYARAAESLSLSRMTFSHQLVRLVFAEQLYRAFTILNHEPYHHE